MNVCVVALGKIGLPLAVQIALRGHRVVGVDVNPVVVDLVNRAQVPFPGEPQLPELLAEAVGTGRLRATTETAEGVRDSEVVVVVVPLDVDQRGTADFSAIDRATEAIAPALGPGALVSYETTLPVGTTRGRFLPMLEEASPWQVGQSLYLCHSPERVSSGSVFRDLRRYPKLVGGVDPESARRAVQFYEAVLEFDDRPDLLRPNGVWDLGTAEAAELTKLVETTYRHINIAMANEFAQFADRLGVDLSQVIEAANSQPYSHLHRPGVKVGGHCIPVYPRFYLQGHPEAMLPAAAGEINDAMPAYVVAQLEEVLGSLAGQRVAIFGIAYRGGVKETAHSGAFPLRDDLERRGAHVFAEDPLFSDEEVRALGFSPLGEGEVDAIIVQSDHDEYRRLQVSQVHGARVVFDGRWCVDPSPLVDAGITVAAIGRPLMAPIRGRCST